MDLSDLINSIDLLDYVSQYAEFTEKNGEFWALSPLKSENTPSFSIRREQNTFYDFSSGVGGNVLTFVRYFRKCGYQEAIEILKNYAGFSGEIVQPKSKLAVTQVAKRFAKRKKDSIQGKPTVLSDDYMTRYEKCQDKLAVWEGEGISPASLDRFQVRYDSFSDRLVYPIRDVQGRIVNVGGRTLDPQWKEKGLRKYTYFMPWGGSMQVIYGLSENLAHIQKQQEIILFEGCKSVLLADTWGVQNCGALLTSHLSAAQTKLLAKLGCRVVFALDKEVRIKDDHNIRRLKQFVNVSYIWDRENLLGEKDSPVDRGRDVFQHLYAERRRYT